MTQFSIRWILSLNRLSQKTGQVQTTALVHEAYLRLVDAKGLACQDRTHFFALSAQVMRRILVDAARARVSAKRGGDAPPLDHSDGLNLDEIAGNASQKSADVLALDHALDDLHGWTPEKRASSNCAFLAA
jgi:RNA polymerase sigma factor (TIGR02999 family)